MSSVLRKGKSQRGSSLVNTVIELWLQFCFWPKIHRQKLMCEQIKWLVFPQFCAFLTNYLMKSAHNFQIIFLINDAPCHCNRRKQWTNLHICLNLTWFVLFLLNTSFRMIGLFFQYHSHTLINDFFKPIVVNISWVISMRRYFYSKFSNSGTIFVAERFMSTS